MRHRRSPALRPVIAIKCVVILYSYYICVGLYTCVGMAIVSCFVGCTAGQANKHGLVCVRACAGTFDTITWGLHINVRLVVRGQCTRPSLTMCAPGSQRNFNTIPVCIGVLVLCSLRHSFTPTHTSTLAHRPQQSDYDGH